MCEQCDEYAVALLDCDEELQRTKKYAETLKAHIKRSSQSTKDVKQRVIELEKEIQDMEFLVRHLRKDPYTMTNQELRSLRKHHLDMIGALEAQLLKEKQSTERDVAKIQHTDLLVAANKGLEDKYRKATQELELAKTRLTKMSKRITAAANTCGDGTGGTCVICIDSMAIYAHNTCGCLTYCRMCRTTIQNYRCPICRVQSTGLLKLHNLPW